MFRGYLQKTGNTICGRCPIGLLLDVSHSELLSLSDGYVAVDDATMCSAL